MFKVYKNIKYVNGTCKTSEELAENQHESYQINLKITNGIWHTFE